MENYDIVIETLDDIEHVLKRPDTYIGSTDKENRDLLIFKDGVMTSVSSDTPRAMEHLFVEILTNAVDACNLAKAEKLEAEVIVKMDTKQVSVKSIGVPVPVKKVEFKDPYTQKMIEIYKPHQAFGYPKSGSNFSDKRVVRSLAGRNGIGSKATNIWSTQFKVIIEDHFNKKKYTQEWTENMRKVGQPEIEKYKGDTSSVEVIFTIDFKRFGYSMYPPEIFDLYRRHVVDASFTTKVQTSFNGENFNYSNIRDYAQLYWNQEISDTGIVHYQWPEDTPIEKKKKGQQVSKDGFTRPTIELIVLDTPNSNDAATISFVNGMMTMEGGSHVDAVVQEISKIILTYVKLPKVKDKKQKISLTTKDVKPHLSIIISYVIDDAKFSSQIKEKMTRGSEHLPKLVFNEEEFKAVAKWNLITKLDDILLRKQDQKLANSDGKNRAGRVTGGGGTDANQAGKARRMECTLFVSEGKSGGEYVSDYIALTPEVYELNGELPLRGKALNDINASIDQRINNKEFNNLKRYLGLQEGFDYTKEEEYTTLRYGHLMIMADSDDDGKHIIGLILAFFDRRFPSLLQIGFVSFWRTPILRAYKGAQTLSFYTDKEYANWLNNNSEKKWKLKYFKGLGSSKKAEIKEDKENPRKVICVYDEKAHEAIQVAFNAKLVSLKKTWLIEHEYTEGADEMPKQPITYFVNNEISRYSFANIIRSIPSIDGLKESHRKLVWAAIVDWKMENWVGKNMYNTAKNAEEVKLPQFVNGAAKITDYHHGETILEGVTASLANDFVGANNMIIFVPSGQFGSRLKGAKGRAAGRYLHTAPSVYFPYIFRPEDIPILEQKQEDGKTIEPKIMLTTVPLALINGCQGVASGWSTFIPKHNPLDVIGWLKMRLEGNDNPFQLKPWYQGFNGEIYIVERKKKSEKKSSITNDDEGSEGVEITAVNAESVPEKLRNNIEGYTAEEKVEKQEEDGKDESDSEIAESEESEDEEERILKNESRSRVAMVTLGDFYIEGRTIVITELPIGKWSDSYQIWGEKLLKEKRVGDFRPISKKDYVHFEIDDFKLGSKEHLDHVKLGLSKSYGLTNMVLLNDNNRPMHFNNANDIAEAFYNHRLPFYQKRKEYFLDQLEKKIKILTDKYRFLKAVVIDRTIRVINSSGKDLIKRNDIYKAMDNMKPPIPHDVYDKILLHNVDEEGMEKVKKEKEEKEKERDELLGTKIEDIWLKELDELEEVYKKHYVKTEKKKIQIRGKAKRAKKEK